MVIICTICIRWNCEKFSFVERTSSSHSLSTRPPARPFAQSHIKHMHRAYEPNTCTSTNSEKQIENYANPRFVSLNISTKNTTEATSNVCCGNVFAVGFYFFLSVVVVFFAILLLPPLPFALYRCRKQAPILPVCVCVSDPLCDYCFSLLGSNHFHLFGKLSKHLNGLSFVYSKPTSSPFATFIANFSISSLGFLTFRTVNAFRLWPNNTNSARE